MPVRPETGESYALTVQSPRAGEQRVRCVVLIAGDDFAEVRLTDGYLSLRGFLFGPGDVVTIPQGKGVFTRD
jgi:hypothetical protein